MNKRNRLVRLFVVLLTAVLILAGSPADAARKKKKKNTPAPAVTAAAPETQEEPGPMEEAQRLANYIFAYGELPDNFMTKREAKELGWMDRYWYVSDFAPGMSIGGDYFGNYEKKLPVVKGRNYFEADCFYHGGPRNEYRIIYSDDNHVWYTEDHYNTFTELYPTDD